MSTRPLIQASIELVTLTITGPDRGTLESADLEVAVAPAGGTFSAWRSINSYDPETGEVQVLVGPGTAVGELELGTTMFRVRVTDSPETPIMPAGGIEVIA